jgi:uncharacterized iron-regulated protein
LRQILACLLLAFAAGCTAPLPEARLPEAPGTIVARDGRVVSADELVAALSEVPLVVLGEVHDNPVHHARQAWTVGRLKPGGLAFEMVPSASEEGIQVFREQGGAPGAIGPAIGWDRLGWPDWTLYAPIFEAAPDAYVAGGGVSRADIRQAMASGAAGAYGTGARRLGLDQPLDPATRGEIEDEMIASHCNKLPRSVAEDMVEAQRLRDARFAAAMARAFANGQGRAAVLITGNGHARTDRGVPAYLRLVAPELPVLSVGMVELDAGEDPVAAASGLPFDFVWFSGRTEREDPCAAFK